MLVLVGFMLKFVHVPARARALGRVPWPGPVNGKFV